MGITSTLPGRIILGAILIGVGLKVRQFDSGSADFIEASCKSGERFCEFYRFAFVTLGLGGVWTLLLVVGAFYLVVYDWASSYIRDIAKDLAETATDIHHIANEQVRRHRFSRPELKALIISVFGNSHGQNEPEGEKLGGFVADLLLYFRAGPVWRRQHITQITISEIASSTLRKSYYRWHQRTTFDLFGTSSGVKTHIPLYMSAECQVEDIAIVLEYLQYKVRVGAKEFNLKDFYNSADCSSVQDEGGWRSENFNLTYIAGTIKLGSFLDIDVQDHEVSIIIDENSILLKSDQEYIHTITEATRGLVLQFEVPPNHRVSACHASPAGYRNARPARYRNPRVKTFGQPSPTTILNGGRKAEITSSSWVLPGISSVVIWR